MSQTFDLNQTSALRNRDGSGDIQKWPIRCAESLLHVKKPDKVRHIKLGARHNPVLSSTVAT